MKMMVGKFSCSPFYCMVLGLLLLTACKKDESTYQVMLMHAAPGTGDVDFYLQETVVATNVSFGGNSAYTRAIVDGNSKFIAEVRSSDDGTLLVTEFNPELINGEFYSLIIFGTVDDLAKAILSDAYSKPVAGEASVRFIHLSLDAPALNILANGIEVVSNKEYYGDNRFNGATGFQDVNAGTYVISFQEHDSGNTIYSSNEVVFEAGQVYTIYAKGLVNGIGDQVLGLGMVTMN